MIEVRKITNKIYAAVEEGTLTWQQVGEAALRALSEDAVALMAHNEEFFLYEEEEEWTPDNADYCDVGSRHHY